MGPYVDGLFPPIFFSSNVFFLIEIIGNTSRSIKMRGYAFVSIELCIECQLVPQCAMVHINVC